MEVRGDILDGSAEKETIAELREKIQSLEERNVRLMEDLQTAESDKRYSDGELYRLQKDLTRLRNEMERIKAPPLIVATLRDVLPDNRVVVKSSTGPDFVVSVSEYCPREDLIVGSRVALNKQTLAVMNVLPTPFDPAVSDAEIMEKPGSLLQNTVPSIGFTWRLSEPAELVM